MLGLTNNTYVLDLETSGLITRDLVPEVICWSVYSETFEYFGWGTSELSETLSLLAAENLVPVFHNASFDVSILRAYGIEVPKYHDTMIMSYAMRTSGPHSLASWGERLEVPKLLTPKWLKPVKKGGKTLVTALESYTDEMKTVTEEYCVQDTKTTWELLKFMERKMDEATYQTYLLDLAYSTIILDMECTGVYIDRKSLLSLKENFCSQLESMLIEIANNTHKVEVKPLCYKREQPDKEHLFIEKKPRTDGKEGDEYFYKHYVEFNPNSGDHVAQLLMEQGWQPKQLSSKTGKPVVDKFILEELAPKYVLAELLTKYNKLEKLVSTYLTPFYEDYIDSHNIIRPSFNQCVTVTGRLSSSRPNFQNLPRHGENGKAIRGLVCAPNDDWVLIGGDLSNIEARIFACYLAKYGNPTMANAFRDGLDFHQANADQWGCSRDMAKKILYTTLYGGGANRIATDTGMPISEAKALITKFNEACPELEQINEAAIREVKRNGYVTTLFGRRIHYDYPTEAKSREDRQLQARIQRQVGNCLFQSAAGDILKRLSLKAAPVVWALEAHFIIQAHDEVIICCHTSVAERLRKHFLRMFNQDSESSWISPVPIVADFVIGRTWNDTH